MRTVGQAAAKLRYIATMVVDPQSEEVLWRIEEACAAAYPASCETVVDGWLMRAAGGPSRRVNSVNPVRDGAVDPSAVIEPAVRFYKARRQHPLFRVVSFVGAMDAPLAERNWLAEGHTLTLAARPVDSGSNREAAVELTALATSRWLKAWQHCRPDIDSTGVEAFRSSVGRVRIPAVFACRSENGAPAAVAYAALDRGVAVLEAVVTHPAHRRRGHAAAVVGALQQWAARNGADMVCLQVAADNDPARRLYAGLGFGVELYRYHYRRAPSAAC